MILSYLIMSLVAVVGLCDIEDGVVMDYVAMDSDGEFQCKLRGTVGTTGEVETATAANQLEPLFVNFHDYNETSLQDLLTKTKGNFVCSIEQTTSSTTKLTLDGTQTGHCGNYSFGQPGDSERLKDYKPWPKDSYKFNCTTKAGSNSLYEMICDLELDGDSIWWLPRKDFKSKEMWYRLHLEEHKENQTHKRNSDGSLALDRNIKGYFAKMKFKQSETNPCQTLIDGASLFSYLVCFFVILINLF